VPASLTVPFGFPSIWMDAEPRPDPRAPMTETLTPVKVSVAVAPDVADCSTKPPYAPDSGVRVQPLEYWMAGLVSSWIAIGVRR